MATSTDAPAPRSRWPLAIVLAFAVVIAINALFIWVAIDGRDPVVPSYETVRR